MNTCIICGEHSGFGMICDKCRQMLLYYRTKYDTRKALEETTDLDEKVFENFYNSTGIGDLVQENVNGFLPPDIDTLVKEVKEYLDKTINKDWLTKKEGRFDSFWEYIEKRMRSDYSELISKQAN